MRHVSSRQSVASRLEGNLSLSLEFTHSSRKRKPDDDGNWEVARGEGHLGLGFNAACWLGALFVGSIVRINLYSFLDDCESSCLH